MAGLYFLALAVIAVSLSALMAGAWVVQQRTGNSGWVDTVWTFSVGLVGAGSALWPIGGVAPNARQWLVAVLVAIWSLRLGTHIAIRTAGITDDPRYAAFAREWGAHSPRRMFIFLQNQALGSIPLVFAIFVAARFPGDGLRLADYFGALILLVGIAGEAMADAQLRAFRADPANKGRVCDVGLWRWSRHPNYFFEWLVWLAFPVIGLSTDFRFLILGVWRRCWGLSSCTGSWFTSPGSAAGSADAALARRSLPRLPVAHQRVLSAAAASMIPKLWMARRFRHSLVTAVPTRTRSASSSKAKPQRRGLTNLRVFTSDLNVFTPAARFDRIVSVEMFEHMTNWRELMTRVRAWLKSDGRFFPHIFTHRSGAYLFDRADGEDWIARHFVTGGVMPSHHLIRQYADLFEVDNITSARRMIGWTISTRTGRRSSPCSARSMAAIPFCGCGAGAGSFSRPRACSATPGAASGASAITG